VEQERRMHAVLNPEADIRIVRQGREQEPVIVIDDMLAAPDEWRGLAARLRYGQIGPFYPGIRALVPEAAAAAMRAELEDSIARTFGLNPVPPLFECYFSVVTTPPEALAPIQRLPHVDGVEQDRIAILIYLSGQAMGGTAFYRQRATGFETLDEERYPRFEAALRAGVAEHGMPPPAYIAGDTPLYEQIATYEARPNRALVYRSCALHCAEIPQGTALPANPAEGRLTINSFLFDPHARADRRGASPSS
jgi:Family of unknown function (DUF6445)